MKMSKIVQTIRSYPAITAAAVQLGILVASRVGLDLGAEIEASIIALSIALGAAHTTSQARSRYGLEQQGFQLDEE